MFGALLALLPSVKGLTRSAELPASPTPEVSLGDETTTDGDADGLEWPDDCDAVPSWRLTAEELSAVTGLPLPNYRTKREYEAMLALIEERLQVQEKQPEPVAPPVIVEVSAVEPLAALPAAEAAAEFLDHLRGKGFGRYTNESLTEEYLRFCRANNRTPAPENFVRQKLRRMVGITSQMIDDRDDVGKRIRWTQWTVVPFSSEQVAA